MGLKTLSDDDIKYSVRAPNHIHHYGPHESSSEHQATFPKLPPEIHYMISQQLIYPDALSLKYTCRYFFHFVDTGIKLKVDWLVGRRNLQLECPSDKRCDLGSDLKFCCGSVRILMQRHREHMECESRPGLACLVYGTNICTHRQQIKENWMRWMRPQLAIELWWILFAMVPFLLGWTCMFDFAKWRRDVFVSGFIFGFLGVHGVVFNGIHIEE